MSTVPLPWDIEIPDNKEDAIRQNVWRWKGYQGRSYIAHVVWDRDEFTYKTLCGRQYGRTDAPLDFAPDNAQHCKNCQAQVNGSSLTPPM